MRLNKIMTTYHIALTKESQDVAALSAAINATRVH